MKKYLAVFLAMSSLLFMGVSCVSSDEDDVQLSPYALLKSFSLGNIRSAYPAFTSTGEDTVVIKTIATTAYPFTINQATGEVFNYDSLPYNTDVSKLVTGMSAVGVVSIYVDSTETYEHFVASDSTDFTAPRKFRIYSADAQYYKDYTIRVNVHQVEPDLMVWNRSLSESAVEPVRLIEFDGQMRLFGTSANGKPVVMSAAMAGEPQWYPLDVTGIASPSAFRTIQKFAGRLYAVSGGDLYCSENATDWSLLLQGYGFEAIIGASDDDGKLWLATADAIYSTADGSAVTSEGAVPADFPLYGVSAASYPMSHNKGIVRYMLVGHATPEMDGRPFVWSRISTESRWVKYDNIGNPYPCPALKDLAVLRYNDFLYAFGGKGTVAGETVEPFSAFYVSRDNGIVWKADPSFYQRLPKELSGNSSPFAATVDSDNYVWIVCGGDSIVSWKGIINRLGFNNK